MLLSLSLLASFLVTLYFYLTWNFDYWRKRGIFSPKPMPLLGNYPNSALLLRNILYEQQQLYEAYKSNHRFIGVFERRSPKLLILDPKLVSDVYVKHFKHFQINDSSGSFDSVLDPIFSRNIFAAQYETWRVTRPEISPAFTQVKIKQMLPIISNSARKLSKYIGYCIEEKSYKTINIKDLCSRFTTDTVMHCIYGLNSEAFDKNTQLSVHENLVNWFSPSLAKNIYNAILSTFPLLGAIWKPSFFPRELTEWLYNTTDLAILHRQQSDSSNQKNDFLEFLLERKQLKNYSNADLSALAAIFFFDAFETSGMILAQAFYYVASNAECQKRLRDEIMSSLPLEKCPSIEDIDAMQYLDNIVNETLRISPSAFLLAKNCTEQIELKDYNGMDVLIEKGTSIQLPVYAIHHDETFYDDPNIFKPERFESISVNDLRKSGIFLPFGDGPRKCIGQKFATYQIKFGLIEMIRHYSLSVNFKTNKRITASALDSLLTPISDIHLDLCRLN